MARKDKTGRAKHVTRLSSAGSIPWGRWEAGVQEVALLLAPQYGSVRPDKRRERIEGACSIYPKHSRPGNKPVYWPKFGKLWA